MGPPRSPPRPPRPRPRKPPSIGPSSPSGLEALHLLHSLRHAKLLLPQSGLGHFQSPCLEFPKGGPPRSPPRPPRSPPRPPRSIPRPPPRPPLMLGWYARRRASSTLIGFPWKS